MFKNLLKGFSVILGLIFIVGCASTKGVEVRRYVEVKDRVDQNMEGNAGYLAGDPQPEDRSEFKKTRKIYVVEVSQGDLVEEETILEDAETGMQDTVGDVDDGAMMDDPGMGSDNFIEASKGSASIPYIGDDNEDFVPVTSSTEYTVKKDDTLQKISKKFYDTYSKWPKIYEANKDVIEDPNRIKPGIVIQIPAL